MNIDISIIVIMVCKKTPKTLRVIQDSFNVFLALSGYSIEEIMEDENLLAALNRHVNNDLVDVMDVEYGSVIINLVYKN